MFFTKPFPDVSKIEIFVEHNFKQWQERIFSLLDLHGVVQALTDAKPNSDADQQIQQSWLHANKVCHHTILQIISNEFFVVYCSYKEAKDIWEALIKQHTAEDAIEQKFVVGKFYQWQIIDDKEIKSQITEYQKLLEEFKSEDIVLQEKFIFGVLTEKLPESWNDYKNSLKHKQKNQTLNELVMHILIEDTNRKRSKEAKVKEMSLKANLVQSSTSGKDTMLHSVAKE